MQLTEEHRKIIAEQEKNCPFCRIIKGEIPSKVIFKDDLLYAVLDINPLAEGHVLLMPKKHYPILPFIPDKAVDELFNATVNLSTILKQEFLSAGTTVFIANGAAAGQQSTHFLIHLVPRSPEVHRPLNLAGEARDEEETEEMRKALRDRLGSALAEEAAAFPMPEQKEEVEAKEVGPTHEEFLAEVLRIVKANPELERLIETNPEEIKKSIPHHPQLGKIFHRVTVEEVVQALRGERPVDTRAAAIELDRIDEIMGDEKATLETVLRIVEANPELRKLIEEDPELVKRAIPHHPQLARIFRHVQVEEVAKAIMRGRHVQEKDSKPDLDRISSFLGDRHV